MCGIVGAIAQRDVVPILLEGLKRLEYRGYDSAGLAVVDDGQIKRQRRIGKVSGLEKLLDNDPTHGTIGIAHTRWATHGKPSTENAHPHVCRKKVAIVHNGIIENHEQLRSSQLSSGYEFTSQTDTEVIVHEIYEALEKTDNLLDAVKGTVKNLEGAYALGVISFEHPDTLITCRKGSPLVIGVGIGEYFIASDVAALLPVTQRFIFLEDGDIAEITRERLVIYNEKGIVVERPIKESSLTADSADKGEYRHYMLKEIFEQPHAISETLEGRFIDNRLQENAFGPNASEVFDSVKAVQILACGTSFHAGLVAKYWFEELARVPCYIEVASEFRYRKPVLSKDTLIVTISQSGETADTLAALNEAKKLGAKYSLSICNVPESSLVRESDLVMMTRAGPEVGVASTKAFTTQLVALQLLIGLLMQAKGGNSEKIAKLVADLKKLPALLEQSLEHDKPIEKMAEHFIDKNNALFLGRGDQYPVAMEGALKLKEISYIHAEAYPAGELKHGPLALVDSEMPIVAVAPNTNLLEKLKSNLEEVRSRGGVLYLFADKSANITKQDNIHIIEMEQVPEGIAPIIYTIPLQLLSYHVAVFKGTDVDKPRNLAKSVTVE